MIHRLSLPGAYVFQKTIQHTSSVFGLHGRATAIYLAPKYSITLELRNSHVSIISILKWPNRYSNDKPLLSFSSFVIDCSIFFTFTTAKPTSFGSRDMRGILGNEIADELARSTPVSAPLFLLLSHLDLLTDHRNSHTQSLTTHFIDNINHHSDYFRIQPSLPNKPWFVNFPSLPSKGDSIHLSAAFWSSLSSGHPRPFHATRLALLSPSSHHFHARYFESHILRLPRITGQYKTLRTYFITFRNP